MQKFVIHLSLEHPESGQLLTDAITVETTVEKIFPPPDEGADDMLEASGVLLRRLVEALTPYGEVHPDF